MLDTDWVQGKNHRHGRSRAAQPKRWVRPRAGQLALTGLRPPRLTCRPAAIGSYRMNGDIFVTDAGKFPTARGLSAWQIWATRCVASVVVFSTKLRRIRTQHRCRILLDPCSSTGVSKHLRICEALQASLHLRGFASISAFARLCRSARSSGRIARCKTRTFAAGG